MDSIRNAAFRINCPKNIRILIHLDCRVFIYLSVLKVIIIINNLKTKKLKQIKSCFHIANYFIN